MYFYTLDSDHPQEIEIHRSYETNLITIKDRFKKEIKINTLPVTHSDRLIVIDSQKYADMNSTTDYRTPYYYDENTFQNYMIQWRRKSPNNWHVLVLIQQPISSMFPKDLILRTIIDSLKSRHAQVVVYLTNSDADFVSLLTETFAQSIDIGQLLLLVSESDSLDFENSTTVYPNPLDGFNYAYLLDLAYQSKSKYTMMIPPGWHLSANATGMDYVEQAVRHHESIMTTRESMKDFNRTCWTVLSDTGESDVILLDTAEHTYRLSLLLRSSLPYNQKNYTELRNLYCTRFISTAIIVYGPSTFTQILSNLPQPQTVASIAVNSYIDKKDMGIPKWINSTLHLGPIVNFVKPPTTIAFAVTAMIRPVVNTSYLEMFLNALLETIESHFHEKSQFSAMIVVLVGGKTTDEIRSLRKFLESKYTNALHREVITLVDSPVESYTDSMSRMRNTFHLESHERRYWRTKQNLDVGFLLTATIRLCEYVMLLEDDTGFQPEFANRLKSILLEDTIANYTTALLPWAQIVFGFGYSGILIRAIDVPVYAQLHSTFFDERPCDILDIWRLIRDGKRIYIKSPFKLRYKKNIYLKHLGVQSSLQGKTQEVW